MTSKQYTKEYYLKNKAFILLKNRNWELSNPEKRKALQRKYYYQNIVKSRAYQNQWKVQKRNEIRRLLTELKNKPCMDCLGWFEPYQMHFDHREPKLKEFNLALALSRIFTKQKITVEVSKCDVVCANCHAVRTYKQKLNGDF